MQAFRPVILPEEAAPPHAAQCERCELAKQRHRVVWGEGNPDAPVFIVLDNPGSREDREGNPFVCGTRETLQIGMKEAGLDNGLVYVSYLLKCRPVRAYNKPAAREACFPHLQFQFAEKKPQVLFGLGNVVVETLFPGLEADVKSYRGKWHDVQGVPAAFSYHPLAVRRRPVLMKYFIQDLQLVADKVNRMAVE
ncbi:uracil-DNA glycosylase [Paenibacillus allorhizosphaerae]|uniref:Type-4 uracil-DNA glycosylase n=1 Tax=Paenibacillus allorhizosphaerae TaxID=2849866 RepID=A0ABM8VFU2_9BACL|nr:uracil-DNA glycosylase [Paenibacillus allorhizosphaerae]CAG7636019.1 Type-4 uracil-DNA glycosylase [Paenibacillus allorhizosphaerae]